MHVFHSFALKLLIGNSLISIYSALPSTRPCISKSHVSLTDSSSSEGGTEAVHATISRAHVRVITRHTCAGAWPSLHSSSCLARSPGHCPTVSLSLSLTHSLGVHSAVLPHQAWQARFGKRSRLKWTPEAGSNYIRHFHKSQLLSSCHALSANQLSSAAMLSRRLCLMQKQQKSEAAHAHTVVAELISNNLDWMYERKGRAAHLFRVLLFNLVTGFHRTPCLQERIPLSAIRQVFGVETDEIYTDVQQRRRCQLCTSICTDRGIEHRAANTRDSGSSSDDAEQGSEEIERRGEEKRRERR